MFKRFKLKRGEVIRTVMVCIAIVLLLPSTVFAESTGVMSYIDDSGIPPAGSIVFQAYYNNDDAKIQTEDSFNDTDSNGGYSGSTGACVAQPGNFAGDQTGQAYTIYVARPGAGKWGKGTVASLPGSGVAYTTPGTSGNKIPLNTTGYVGLPQNVKAYAGNGVVALKWDAPATGTPTGYRVYRRPSATEVPTRINFDRRGTTTAPAVFFEDTATNGSMTAYIICASNASGYGPHTDEIIVTADATNAPSLTSLTPNSGYVSTSFTIAGSNFGATQGTGFVMFNGIAAAVTSWSNTSIVATVPPTGTSGNVYVVNSSNKVSNGLPYTVQVPGTPTIVSASPSSGYKGDTIASVTITGSSGLNTTHFKSATPTVNFGDGNITVSNINVSDDNHLTCQIVIGAAAVAGTKTVTVTTGGETATGNVFTVNTPSILSVTPASGMQGATITGVAIVGTGTHFSGTPTVSFGSNITASSVVVTNATHLTCNIVIGGSATLGQRSVSVTTGSEIANGTNLFNVTLLPPTFTSISPAQGEQGATLTGVTIVCANTHFSGSTTVNLGSDVTVSNIVATDATHLTCTLAIGSSAVTGLKDVVLGGTDSVTGSGAFSVILHKTGEISKAYPNPFDPNNKANPLQIVFNTATGEAVDTYIFDTNGRVIWQNKDTQITPTRTIVWDGMTSYGEIVDNGLYLIRVVRNGKSVAKTKILVIKQK